MIDRREPDPLEIINTGDIVEVDADRGIVKVTPEPEATPQLMIIIISVY